MLIRSFKPYAFLFAFLAVHTAGAQYGTVTWQHMFPVQNISVGYGLVPGGNGGYALAGQSCTISQLDGRATMISVDPNGALQHQYVMPGAVNSRFYAAARTTDGFIAGGFCDTITSGSALMVTKFDDSLVPVWTKYFDGGGEDILTSVSTTADGGYILGGRTTSYGIPGYHANFDFWVIKLDAAGNMVWQRCYGGADIEILGCVRQTPDLGYILCGYTRSVDGDVTNQHGNGDVWVVKMDASGNITWQNCFGGTGEDFGSDIICSSDGNYVIAGNSASVDGDVTGGHGQSDVWVLKISPTGTILWQKAYGGSRWDQGNKLYETAPGFYTVVGSGRAPNGPDGDLLCATPDVTSKAGWILQFNSAGNLIFKHQFYGNGWAGVLPSGDGGYIVGGSREPSNNYLGSLWIARIDTATSLYCEPALEVHDVGTSKKINVYPTVGQGTVSIDLPPGFDDAEVRMYNMLGSSVPVTESRQGKLNRKVRMGNVPDGAYILVVTNGVERQTFKVICQQ